MYACISNGHHSLPNDPSHAHLVHICRTRTPRVPAADVHLLLPSCTLLHGRFHFIVIVYSSHVQNPLCPAPFSPSTSLYTLLQPCNSAIVVPLTSPALTIAYACCISNAAFSCAISDSASSSQLGICMVIYTYEDQGQNWKVSLTPWSFLQVAGGLFFQSVFRYDSCVYPRIQPGLWKIWLTRCQAILFPLSSVPLYTWIFNHSHSYL